MSETKPLTEQWQDEIKACEKIDPAVDICASCHQQEADIADLKAWAATHLAEQTEPSEEDWQAAAECAERESIQYIRIAWERMHAVNEFKECIRALLCGNI